MPCPESNTRLGICSHGLRAQCYHWASTTTSLNMIWCLEPKVVESLYLMKLEQDWGTRGLGRRRYVMLDGRAHHHDLRTCVPDAADMAHNRTGGGHASPLSILPANGRRRGACSSHDKERTHREWYRISLSYLSASQTSLSTHAPMLKVLALLVSKSRLVSVLAPFVVLVVQLL